MCNGPKESRALLCIRLVDFFFLFFFFCKNDNRSFVVSSCGGIVNQKVWFVSGCGEWCKPLGC